MNVLSIDVAITKPTAYAVFNNKELMRHGKIDSVKEISQSFLIGNIDLIVTEDMYHNKNIGTLKKLCYEVGKVIYIADLHNIKYCLIRPIDWQVHHGLTLKNNIYISKLQKQIISNTTGVETDDEDEQAAILIGLYVIERARLGMKWIK